MDRRIMNTHQYPEDSMKKYTDICVFNAFKAECIETISRDFHHYQELERKKYLVNDYSIAPILNTEVFLDEDGHMKRLPDYVVEQIREAVGSINLEPSPLTMKVSGDNYVLSVTYIDEENDNTKIMLEYTFNKKELEFEGYFAKSIENQDWLPDYEIIQDTDHKEEIRILANYRNDSSLKVNMESIRPFTLSPLSFPDRLQNCLTNRSLKEAVLRRIFPTKAHCCKHLINEMIVKGQSDFRDMRLTPLNWVKLSMDDSDYNLYAKYMLMCHRSNKSQPIVYNQLSDDDEDKIKAMKILIEDYPFLTIDDHCETDVCVLDLWTKYFKKELTGDEADQMKFSDSVARKIFAYYSSNPEKCSEVFEQFPKILNFCMFIDFPARYQLLCTKYDEDYANNAAINLDHVLYFNRLVSNLPNRWQLHLREGTFGMAACERGPDIIKQMEYNFLLTSATEKVNYLHVKNEEDPLSEFQMRTFIDLLDNQMEILHPKHLEQKFQSYRFSEDCKNSPTEMDCLAVRFANVYGEMDYDVPEIPGDFQDRLKNLEKPAEKGDEIQLNCVICAERTKSHMFPTCKHVCVCELCSYSLLECPICRQDGNPQRVFL